MLEAIGHFFDVYWYYGYLIVFLGMIIEGAGVALMTSFLAQQGHFNIYFLVLVMFGGTILGSVIWYQLGRLFYGTAVGDWFRKHIFLNEGIFEKLLQKNSRKTLFVSKFIYGFDRAAVILSGLIKINFAKFLKIELLANSVWLAAMFSLGYFSGAALDRLKSSFQRIEIIFLLILLIYIILEVVIKKKFLHKIYDYLKQNNKSTDNESPVI